MKNYNALFSILVLYSFGMKVSKNAMTSAEFRNLAEHISKYVDLRGCRSEKCINNRFKRINSKKLKSYMVF